MFSGIEKHFITHKTLPQFSAHTEHDFEIQVHFLKKNKVLIQS